MAYREFENSPTWLEPQIDILPKTIAVVQSAVQQRARQQQQNRNLAATYKADKLESKFTTDQLDLNRLTQENTNSAVNDILTQGYISPSTRTKLTRAQGYAELSKVQWQMKEDLEKAINDRVIKGPKAEKNYYDKAYDAQRLVDAAYGTENEEVKWDTRADRLQQVAATIGNDYINSFNKEAFLNDYVDVKKTEMRSKDSKGTSGVKIGNKVTAVFFDENGAPKVTDKHAIEALDSSPDLQAYYKQVVDMELLDDAKKMIATKEGQWLKDLTPAQIISAFREDPSLNKESRLTPGQRELKMAKSDLEKRQRVNLENSYDAGDYNDASGVGITNKKVGHSFTFHQGQYAGPGGVIPLKTGKSFSIPSTSSDRLDLNTGRVSHSLKGKRDFNVEGYQLIPVQGNNPVQIQAASPDEYIQKIKEIPLSSFDPEGKSPITGLRVALKGTTFDKARIIQQTFDAEKPLNKQLAEAVKSGDEEAVNRIQKQKDAINRMRQLAGQDELDEEDTAEFQSLLPFLGIEGIEYNELVLANPQDIANVKAVTGGFDVSNSKNWDEDMLSVQRAFNDRRNQAIQANYNREATREIKVPNSDQGTPPKKPELAVPAVPVGRVIVIKDGRRYHIPLEQKEEALKAGYKLEE